MEKILVTGGCGYIGSHVVRQLTEGGYSVVVYDNLSTGFRENLTDNVELVVGELSDKESLQKLFDRFKFKTILHFAASIIAPESVSQPLKYYSNNSCNSVNLLQVATANKISKFIFSSTAAVYGIPADGVASEDSETKPINPYGNSKLISESIIRDSAAAYNFDYAILRYFNVAGADPLLRMGQRGFEATHLIKLACQTALGKRNQLCIYGTDYDTSDGTGVRDYIHVEDLASAHLAALSYLNEHQKSLTINVGYGKGSSVKEVVSVVKEISGVDFKVIEDKRRDGDPPSLIAKADKIRELTSWKPKHDDLRKIVEDAWRWESKILSMG